MELAREVLILAGKIEESHDAVHKSGFTEPVEILYLARVLAVSP